jgi:predicted permease
VGSRGLGLSRPSTGALMVVTCVVNTGYLGVPLIGALLGSSALGAAIAFDSLVSGPMFYVVGIAIGASFGTRRLRGGGAARFLRNPPLFAVLAGLAAPNALAPDVLLHTAHLVVYAMLVLGFFVLGINLAAEAGRGALRLPPPLTRPVAAAMGLRMVLAPALRAALAAAVGGIPHAYLIQAAMPAGISSLVVGHAYGLDLRLTASALAWTTLAAVAAAIVVAVA